MIDVDRDGLEAAIARVQASFEAARVSSYGFSAGAGNILIQRMVDAEYSGVLFTRDPSAGGLAMVEMVQGTAENLVSGMVRPQSYRFGRVTKKPFGKDAAPIDLGPLLEMGDVAERLFGGPQDMEWAYRDGRFHLVQSRDITRPVAGDADMAAMQNDLARAIDIAKGAAPDQVVFAKNELSEMLPRPTPLSLSLMESLWAAGGSVDLAARELGLTLPRRGRLELSRDHPRPALRRQARGAIAGARHQRRSPHAGCCARPIASSATSASTSCRSSSTRPVC